MTVVDASVFVAYYRPQDLFHSQSRAWLQAQVDAEQSIVAPVLVLAEVAGAVTRRADDTALGQEVMLHLQRFPRLTLVPIDEQLAEHAGEIASIFRLHGADAIYVAVADVRSLALASWDDEVLTRGGQLVPTIRPDTPRGPPR